MKSKKYFIRFVVSLILCIIFSVIAKRCFDYFCYIEDSYDVSKLTKYSGIIRDTKRIPMTNTNDYYRLYIDLDNGESIDLDVLYDYKDKYKVGKVLDIYTDGKKYNTTTRGFAEHSFEIFFLVSLCIGVVIADFIIAVYNFRQFVIQRRYEIHQVDSRRK